MSHSSRLSAVTLLLVCSTACRESVLAPAAPSFSSVARPYHLINLSPPDVASHAVAINAAGQVAGWMDIGGQRHGVLWDQGATIDIGPDNQPFAINAGGQVAGCHFSASGADTAFLWERGVAKNLNPFPGDSYSCASSINSAGQVVGFGGEINASPSPCHPLLWDHGTVTNLGALDGFCAFPTAINAAGQVVGFTDLNVVTGSQALPFLWDRGTLTALGTLGGNITVPEAINPAGQIAGWSTLTSGDRHAVLWDQGTMTDLGTLGGASSQAFAINPAGQVVGESATPSGDGHAFLWERGTMIDLGTLGGAASIAIAINPSGVVLGSSATDETGSESHPFVWKSGTMIDLGTGGFQVDVVAINASGQVIGQARIPGHGLQHAVLWTQ